MLVIGVSVFGGGTRPLKFEEVLRLGAGSEVWTMRVSGGARSGWGGGCGGVFG